jgi:uncharacterized membrane protein YvbJ
MAFCRECGAALEGHARFCSACGTAVVATDASVDTGTAPPMSIGCPFCGAEVPGDAERCPECNRAVPESLRGGAAATAAPAAQQNSIFWQVLAALAVFFIGVPLLMALLGVGCAACSTTAGGG